MRTAAIGSLPGTDVGAGIRLALEATAVPWLPEFPARGPWAGMIGRALGLLDELGAGLDAGTWRLGSRPGLDQRRARAALRDDSDIWQENAEGLTGPFKVSVCGPWTLASSVLLPLGGRVVGDRGARRDLGQALASGVAAWVADLERRMPGVDVLVQIDEPLLPSVMAGTVPTEGGYFRHRAVERQEVAEALRVLDADVLHCCAPGLDVDLILSDQGAGFAGVSLDQDLITPAQWDQLGSHVDAGRDLWLGCAPTASGVPLGADELTRRALAVLRPWELGDVVAERVVLTPACGLASWTSSAVSALFASVRVTAGRLEEELAR